MFVILPPTLCHSERSEESRLERPRRSSLGPRAVSRRSSEQDERKSGCLKRSELPDFRPVSVAKACEAHEALTFWLLLGQAKSNRKRFFADALNDKLMVNCQWLIVMRGTRNPNAEEHPPIPPSKGECGAVSHQQTACGMPCRGEPRVRPFFVLCRGVRTQISQIGANGRCTPCTRHDN